MFAIQQKSLKLNSAEDVESYCQEIEGIANLTEISLSGNSFGVQAAQRIATALGTHKTLTTVHLNDMFTGRLKDEIPLALDAFVAVLVDQPLVEVDFSDNAFGPAGAKPLQRLIIENRNIQVLKLNNNGLGIQGARLISEALTTAAEKNKESNAKNSLRTLLCGRNRMEAEGAGYLAQSLKLYHDSLQTFRIFQNSIRPDGIVFLMECIANCGELRVLDLQDNTFTDKGALAFTKAVANLSKLEELNLGDCLLGKDGGAKVIQSLAANTSLQTILLGFNEIDKNGADLVAPMLKNKKNLVKLDLNGNCFSADGVQVDRIKQVLEEHDLVDALDPLDEMEEESDYESEDEGDEIDQLANKVAEI